eukprot:1941620-Rhodomonas_salina.1
MSDSGVLCTGLLTDVLQLHVSEMAAEGKIAQFLEQFKGVNADLDPRGYSCSHKEELEREAVGSAPQLK